MFGTTLKYYQVHGYSDTTDRADVETECETKSLKKAYRVFEQAKKRYPKVRLDEWSGSWSRDTGFDGDYARDVECWVRA